MRLPVIVALAAIACRQPPTVAPPDASTPADEAPPPDAEERDALAALSRVYPLVCIAMAGDSLDAVCHDDVVGFAAARKCYADALAKAKDAQAKKPPSSAKFECGKTIESVGLAYVDGRVELLTANIAWLDAHKTTLSPLMASKSIWHACEDTNCENQPASYLDKYKAAGIGEVNTIECTKRLFQIGPPDNVAWLQKVVTARGLSCNPADKPPALEFKSRATGHTL